MKTTTARMVYAGLLCLLLSGDSIWAKPFDPPKEFQLEFGGGTTGEFVDLLRRKVPGFEIVITPSASKSRLESLKVNRVSPHLVLELLQRVNPELLVETLGMNTEGSTLVHISLPRTIGVESIGDLVAGDDLTDLSAAIDSALKLLPAAQRVDLKAHMETGLLIVSGSREQVETASKVVRALRSTATSPHSISEADSIGSDLTVEELRSRIQFINDEIALKTRLLSTYKRELQNRTAEDSDEPKSKN